MSVDYEQWGWKKDNTEFAIGEYAYSDAYTGPVSVSPDLKVRSQWFEPRGSLAQWAVTANAVVKPAGLIGQAVVLAGFASVFMGWQDPLEGGAIFSLVSRESGTGKTMLLTAAASIWGQMEGMRMKAIDTDAGMELLLSGLGNLPAFFDEFGEMARKEDPQRVAKFVQSLTLGEGRKRAQQSGRSLQHVRQRFALLLLTASNYSVVDHLAVYNTHTDAPGMRILEFIVALPAYRDQSAGDALKAELLANAGTAGDVFLTYLLQPEVLDFSRKALRQWTGELWKTTGWPSKYRFWIRTLGAILVAGHVVKELDLLACEPWDVVQFLIKQLSSPETVAIPTETPVSDLSELVGAYINAHNSHYVTVAAPWRPGTPIAEPMVRPHGRLMMRYETSTGRMYTPAKDFRAWLVTTGFGYSDTLARLLESQMLISAKKSLTLGAGTPIPSAAVTCLEFDLLHPQLSALAKGLTMEAKHGKNPVS